LLLDDTQWNSTAVWTWNTYLDQRSTDDIWVTAVDGLLDKGLFDVIDHQVETIGFVVDEQADKGALRDSWMHGIG
jgi:GrpB-like predicted nucleotidyltransferase (UPF0157 family)